MPLFRTEIVIFFQFIRLKKSSQSTKVEFLGVSALYLFVPFFWVTEYLIQLRQSPLPVPELQPGLSGPFTIPALTFHNYFISLIFPMAGSAPGGPQSSPSSIRQSLIPSALLSPPILIFAGSLTVSLLLSFTHTKTYMHTHHSMGNTSTIWRETKTN